MGTPGPMSIQGVGLVCLVPGPFREVYQMVGIPRGWVLCYQCYQLEFNSTSKKYFYEFPQIKTCLLVCLQ